ncbi:MAG: integrase [Robiginitomaculum sp.]|nr:MAG: integrase [Robiginitomaculum sp.]
MATILKLKSGSFRVQIRRRGQYASKTFLRRADAQSWALETERRADRGESINAPKNSKTLYFRNLIDLHIADMKEVRKPLRRSKEYSLNLLRKELGHLTLKKLNRERIIEFGRKRAKQGAGPATLCIDICYIHTIITHAAAVHGIDVSKEDVDLARVALRRLGLIGRSIERDRRPTQTEIDSLIAYFDNNKYQKIPVGRLVEFALATAMRQSEICRIKWSDVDERTRCVTVCDRKDPRKKIGNNQRVPMIDLTGYDAWEILKKQKRVSHNQGRVFPYNGRSAGTAFRKACVALKIKDLRFHDLRHEATSRLFEAGLSIERVALVTGHKDWKMLQRYTHLDPAIVFARPNA